jgi:hypothetical protein
MSILDLINNERSEIDKDTQSVNQTIVDLVRQLDGTVNLIKAITDKHGKNVILANMTEEQAGLFSLLWAKLELAVEDTDYPLPELTDKE